MNVIVGDEWEVVPILKLAATGRLTIFDLLAQHNEHRMPFGYLAILILARFTRYDTVVEMLFSWVLLCMTALLLFLVFRRKFGGNPGLLAFLPVSLILFGFGQYESILWGFVVQIYLMIFGVVAALYLLHTSKQINLRFALSSICAIVASFSLITGLMVWPAGLTQILMSQNERKWRRAIVWVLVGVVTCTFYFYGWVKPGYEPPLDFVLRNPMASGEYFLALVGNVFMFGEKSSIAYGLVISLIAVLVVIQAHKRGLLRKNGIWFSLIVFSFLASMSETVGRSGFGLWQALEASRYTPLTALGIIGIYLLSLSIYRSNAGGRMSRRFGTHALLALFLLGLIFSYNAGWQVGQMTRDSRQMGAYVLLTYKIQSDENIRSYDLYPTPEIVRERAQYLDQSKLNVFSEPTINASTLLPSSGSTLFSLEAINEIRAPQPAVPIVVNASKQQTVTLVGWAVDKQANGAASAVFITVDGKLDIPALYGLDREDVANGFKNPNFRYSGFVASFASSILSKGIHTLSLKIVAADGIHFYYAQQVASLSVS